MLNRLNFCHSTRSITTAANSRYVTHRFVIVAAILVGLALPAQAQLPGPLSHIDLALAGAGLVTLNTSGYTPASSALNYQIFQNASSTAAVLATVRYTRSMLEGGEFNFLSGRMTEDYNVFYAGTTTPALTVGNPFTVQTGMQEYSVGYVAHGPKLLGMQPFASVGIGTLKLKPTPLGGLGLLQQFRMEEYVTAGIDDPLFLKNFGIRLQIRDVFYKAPDFGQNYLTSNAHTSTIEPTFGFYMRF